MEVSPGFLSNDLTIHEFPIEESNMPHHLWGLEGSRCSYKTEGTIFPLSMQNLSHPFPQGEIFTLLYRMLTWLRHFCTTVTVSIP